MSFDKDYEFDEGKEELNGIFRRLGEIIKDTLADSKEIHGVIDQLKGLGLCTELSMIICLGLSCRPGGCATHLDDNAEKGLQGEIRFELTSGDREFLRNNYLRMCIEKKRGRSEDSEDCNPLFL